MSEGELFHVEVWAPNYVIGMLQCCSHDASCGPSLVSSKAAIADEALLISHFRDFARRQSNGLGARSRMMTMQRTSRRST